MSLAWIEWLLPFNQALRAEGEPVPHVTHSVESQTPWREYSSFGVFHVRHTSEKPVRAGTHVQRKRLGVAY